MHTSLDAALRSIEKEIADLSLSDLERHLPGKWSAAQILEHLALTFEGTRRNLQKCLDTGTRRATRAGVRQRAAVLVVVELGWFPSGVEAPAAVRPKGLASSEVKATLRRNLVAMDEVMRECEARFGSRCKIADHPLLGPLSLRPWRRFHSAHVRHHLKQIRDRARGEGQGRP